MAIKIGFSTSGSFVSRAIRWFTRSTVSHAWLLVEDGFFGVSVVMEATNGGFRLVPFEHYVNEHTRLVRLVTPKTSLEEGVKKAALWLGEHYDYGGLFGMAVVVVGRWLRRRWRNPWESSRAMFCSEAVVYVLQASGYEGADGLVPSTTSPEDLLRFLTDGAEEKKE